MPEERNYLGELLESALEKKDSTLILGDLYRILFEFVTNEKPAHSAALKDDSYSTTGPYVSEINRALRESQLENACAKDLRIVIEIAENAKKLGCKICDDNTLRSLRARLDDANEKSKDSLRRIDDIDHEYFMERPDIWHQHNR